MPAQFQWAAGAKESPDECELWLTQLTTDAGGNRSPRRCARRRLATARSSTVCCCFYAYVGLYNNKEVVRLDSRTGTIVKRFNVSPSAPYGLVWTRAATSDHGPGVGWSQPDQDRRGGDKVSNVQRGQR